MDNIEFKNDIESDVIKTHIREFDELTGGLRPGSLTVVAGRPISGKTSLLIKIIANIAKYEKRKILFFSLEHAKRGFYSTFAEYGSFVHIDDSGYQSLDTIEKRCNESKLGFNPGIVIIDYSGLIDSPSLQEKLQFLRHLSKRINVPILLTSQLGKIEEESYSSSLKVFETNSDILAIISRYDDESQSDDQGDRLLSPISIVKNQFGAGGNFSLHIESIHERKRRPVIKPDTKFRNI